MSFLRLGDKNDSSIHCNVFFFQFNRDLENCEIVSVVMSPRSCDDTVDVPALCIDWKPRLQHTVQ